MAAKVQITTLCAPYLFISTSSFAWLSSAAVVSWGCGVEAAAIIFASGRMLTSVVMRLKSSTQLLLEIFSCVLILL